MNSLDNISTVNIKDYMADLGQKARKAGREISRTETGKKNLALLKIAEVIEQSTDKLVAENAKDLETGKANGLDSAMLRRCPIQLGKFPAYAIAQAAYKSGKCAYRWALSASFTNPVPMSLSMRRPYA
jgi:hypothetical protein